MKIKADSARDPSNLELQRATYAGEKASGDVMVTLEKVRMCEK